MCYGYGALGVIQQCATFSTCDLSVDKLYQWVWTWVLCIHGWISVRARAQSRYMSNDQLIIGAWVQAVLHIRIVHFYAVQRVTAVVYMVTKLLYIQRVFCSYARSLVGCQCKYNSGVPSSVKVFMIHLLSCAQVDLVLRACIYGSGSPLEIGAHFLSVQRAYT